MKENRYPHVFQPLTVRGLTLKNRLQYAPTVVLKCTPDGQVGQEMLRTKGGDENSYNAGDDTNKLDWDRPNDAEYADNAQYMRGLIKIRKRNAVLRVGAYGTINKNAKVV